MKKFLLFIMFGLLFSYSCTNKVEFSGKVYNDLNGNNVFDTNEPGVKDVKIESGNVTVYSYSDGSFNIEGEIGSAGTTIKLYFSKPGYKDTEKEVEIDYIDEDKKTLGPVNEENNTVMVGMVTN